MNETFHAKEMFVSYVLEKVHSVVIIFFFLVFNIFTSFKNHIIFHGLTRRNICPKNIDPNVFAITGTY